MAKKCIFCLEEKDNYEFTNEHFVPKCIFETLGHVGIDLSYIKLRSCDVCNNGLSEINEFFREALVWRKEVFGNAPRQIWDKTLKSYELDNRKFRTVLFSLMDRNSTANSELNKQVNGNIFKSIPKNQEIAEIQSNKRIFQGILYKEFKETINSDKINVLPVRGDSYVGKYSDLDKKAAELDNSFGLSRCFSGRTVGNNAEFKFEIVRYTGFTAMRFTFYKAIRYINFILHESEK